MRQLRGTQMNTKVMADGSHPTLGDGHCLVKVFVEGGQNRVGL